MLEIALGVLYLSPTEFWSMTYPEYICAFNGWRKFGPPSWFGATNSDGSPKKTKDKQQIQEGLENLKKFREAEKKDSQDPRLKAALRAVRRRRNG